MKIIIPIIVALVVIPLFFLIPAIQTSFDRRDRCHELGGVYLTRAAICINKSAVIDLGDK